MTDNKRKFTFLKSNYTLRTKHKTLNKKDSAIYVRDYMVTTNNGGWDSGSIPYGESNFKMVHRFDTKQERKHSYGKWLNNGNGDVWTLEEIKNGLSKYEKQSEINKKMVMNFNYKSLLDFAYFGSCTELIKSSITDIIKKFPGELYVTDEEYSYYNDKTDEIITIVGDESNGHESTTQLYYIDNPFDIDIFTLSIPPYSEDKLKYFCSSRSSYKILNEKESICGIDMQRWIVEIEPQVNLKCLKEGQFIGKVLLMGEYNNSEITLNINYDEYGEKLLTTSTFIIYVYYQGGKFVYLTDTVWKGYHVRLSEEKIDEFYQTQLDDFEQFILNRNTKPRYLIELETIKETEYGFKNGTITLSWPTLKGGWNLDIESNRYDIYVNVLLEQSELYDEYFSNNLWRMMTHDSIKNMDLTFSNERLNEDGTDYHIGTTKIEGLFWAYGREFDDLKRYIDNLKTINDVSYSEKNNISENVLREKCELNGWEIYSPVQFLNNDIEVTDLYQNQFKNYTISDVRERFFKELCLNSKEIFSRKGTKYGIEMLLSLFGFCSYDFGKNSYPYLSPNDRINGKIKWEELNDYEKEQYYDYKIDEYVAVARNNSNDVISASEELPCERYNALRTKYIVSDEYNMNADTLQGLPVRMVEFVNSNGEVKKYIIPWYDKKQYKENKMYFQMYGGWGKISLKDIDEKIRITLKEDIDFKELRGTEDFKIYSETLKYIKIKSSVKDLLRIDYNDLNEGDIYYIDNPKESEYHYYVLTNKNKSGSLEGWTPVTVEDFNNKTKNVLNVVYLETIIDDCRGNNPHIGYGKYDDGNEYLEYFRHLFKFEIDNSTAETPLFNEMAYDCTTGAVTNEIQNCGFTIGDIVKDNVKTWYFTPTDFSYMELLDKNVDSGIYSISSTSLSQKINVGKKASDEGKTHFESDLSAFNLETQETDSNDEAAANSIINVKNLKITFANKYANFEGFRKYLYGAIVPYIIQIIPSTTIFDIEFDGVESSASANYQFADIAGII